MRTQNILNAPTSGYVKKSLQKDDVYPATSMTSLKALTGMGVRGGLENAIISGGKIVNIVSDNYGHLTNDNFFKIVEKNLEDAGIKYEVQSFNRDNRQFAVDYILNDENIHVNVKGGGKDKIMPMMRYSTSYDGSIPTSGHFGLYRPVCSNGLHVADFEIGFKIRKKRNIEEIVLPRIQDMIQMFLDNKYYSLHRKFEVLAEKPITDISKFVENVCGITAMFNFQKSEKNPNEPSKNAAIVMNTIDTEAKLLHTQPNMWIGYNAFNAFLHGTNKNFEKQKAEDEKLFNTIVRLQDVLMN